MEPKPSSFCHTWKTHTSIYGDILTVCKSQNTIVQLKSSSLTQGNEGTPSERRSGEGED